MIWLGPRIKSFGDRVKAQTLADFFASKYSISVSTLTSLLTIFAFLLWTSIQFIGIASLASVLIGVSLEIALLLAAIITIAYTSFGGLRNDISTDFVQFWIILFIFFLMAIIGWIRTDGFATLSQIPQQFYDVFAFGGPVFFFGSVFLGGLFLITQMDAWQRIYSATSESTVKKSFIASLIICIPLYIIPILFGLWAFKLFPGINAEQGFFTLMKNLLPPGLLGIGFSGVLAAAMSSIDSSIVVGSTSITNDIYARIKDTSKENLLKKARIFSLIFGAVALVIAYLLPNIVKLSIFSSFLTMNFFPAIIGGFFWKKANKKAALWSIILSTFVLLVAWFTIGTNAWAPSLLTSIVLFILISKFSKQSIL